MAGSKLSIVWSEELMIDNEKLLKFHSAKGDLIKTDTEENIEELRKFINENFDIMIKNLHKNRKISGFSIYLGI